MSYSGKLFAILFGLGMIGVLSVLLIDFNAVAALAPRPPNSEILKITPAIKIVSLIQPTLILAVAVVVGIRLAGKVGLSAPVAHAWASGDGLLTVLKPQLFPGLLGGSIGGLCVVLTGLGIRPFLSSETLARLSKFTNLLPLPTRLLYGGITEELLLRWGLMTLLVWLAWRFIQKRRQPGSRRSIITAIVISSVVFALGHLPVAFFLFPEPTLALALYVLVANSAFGLIAGYLYWKKGLEAGIVTHITAHVVMFCANYVQ